MMRNVKPEYYPMEGSLETRVIVVLVRQVWGLGSSVFGAGVGA
jgi:hypothetical protein